MEDKTKEIIDLTNAGAYDEASSLMEEDFRAGKLPEGKLDEIRENLILLFQKINGEKIK